MPSLLTLSDVLGTGHAAVVAGVEPGDTVAVVATAPWAVHAGVVALFLVAGTAQGPTFAASMRSLLTGASAGERAGILAAIYLISYGGAW